MKVIIALEELIKEDEAHIKLAKKQLADHESGVNKLTKMTKGSTEASLELATIRLEKNQNKLQELLQKDLAELEKQERIKEATIRKNYFDFQKQRIKRDKTQPNDIKLEAIYIIDEIPKDVDIGIEDDILYNVAEKSIKMHLSLHEKAHEKLEEIKNDFYSLVDGIKDEDINELAILSAQIAILVLYLSTLIVNISENIESDENEPPFSGFPKFEDWWIQELWINHQAYFGLYKWKQIITGLCQSSEQKKAWEIIFNSWVSIKKYIALKGELAYKYNYAFDTLVRNHTGLEEELATTSLESMESIIQKLLEAEDFTTIYDENIHQLITPYTHFKREQLDYQDVKGKTKK
jgi:hypothetical protein